MKFKSLQILRYCLGVLSALAVLILSCNSCGCHSRNNGQNLPVNFPYVTPPAMLGPQEAPVYFAEHFWDKFLSPKWNYPSDTAMVCGVKNQKLEEAVAGYVSLLSKLPMETSAFFVRDFASSLISAETADSSSVVFETLTKLFERYSFDPNSPVRDEDVYGIYASQMAACQFLSQSERSRYAEDARLCSKNMKGTVATDFRFAYKDGSKNHMLGIHAPYTLLFFSNPGCTACKEIIDVLSTQPEITAMVNNSDLAIINIYIDEDISGWLKYMSIYPEQWHNVFDMDGAIRAEELYNIRAIPSLYLLNSNKVVLLKDATPEVVYRTLVENKTKR